MTRLPILRYHGLHAGKDAHGRFDPVYSVRPDDFARQLDMLLAQGWTTVSLDQAGIGQMLPTTARQVVITFDDGDVSNVEVALPLLAERGMTAEFFITSGFVDQPGMLSTADVRTLADAGMGIGSHGATHAFLEDLGPDALDAELRESRQRLQDASGRDVTALALPGGRGGDRERRVATAMGYRHLLGSVPGPNQPPQPGQWLQRVAVTRELDDARFAALAAWKGLGPRLALARFHALALPKRVLGNSAYEKLRARLL